jgi:hypothetical protein
MADSLPNLSALRAEAASLRARADEIDRKIDDFIAWATEMQSPGLVVTATPRKLTAVGYSSGTAPRSAATKSGKGKPPGTISMKWRGYFSKIRLFDGVQFPLSAVQEYAKKSDGSDQRLTALRRHMKPYIEHGYLVEVESDLYCMTDKLTALLDQFDSSTGSAQTSSPKGETGDVASPASDTLLLDEAACLTATGGGT